MPLILNKAEVRKVLIVKPSSMGDVIHSLPFLNAVRNCFPKTEIHWIIARGLEGLLEGHPMIDRLIIIDKDVWKKLSRLNQTVKEIRLLKHKLRQEKYDLAIDLQGLLRSGLMTIASRAPVRIGFCEAREGSRHFYTDKVNGGTDIHAVDRYLKIADAIGCSMEKVCFPVSLPKNKNISSGLLNEIGRYAVIVPGARWKSKIWPAKRFGRVSAGLPIKSVIVGGKSDRLIADEVVRHAKGNAMSLAGQTDLNGLFDVISEASLVITNDTGPMHIAAALNVPVVAMFGPTDPARTGPYGQDNVIVRAGAKCAPCLKRQCDDMACMKDISADEVLKEALRILG